MNNNNMKKTTKMVYMALLVSMALVLHIIEGFFPVPFITPGAKLGLSNLITVLALYTLNSKIDVLTIIIARVLLATLVAGNMTGFLYSSSGAMLSFAIMIIIKDIGKDKVSIIGVSAAGAVFHNIGQLIVAALIVQNVWVTMYLPVLSIAGIGTGIFVGMTANYIIAHMDKISFFRQMRKL